MFAGLVVRAVQLTCGAVSWKSAEQVSRFLVDQNVVESLCSTTFWSIMHPSPSNDE